MLIMLYVMQACYDDNSSLADQPIIEVGINSGTRDSIDIYFNDTLKINPELEISRSTELTYQWSMGVFKADSTTVYKEISTEKDLKYIVRELGHFHLRQLVTSEDGSTIRYYHVFVNSPFEEGFTILGRRPDGKGSLAFMKTLTKNEEASGMRPKFVQNAFVFANEGKELYLDPVDCDKVDQSLYILHGEGQRLVQIDAKTFKVLMEYDFRYYDANFIPTRLMCYDGRFSREFYVPSKNGGVAQVQTVEQDIFPYPDLPKEKGIIYTDANDRPSYFSSCSKVYIGSTPGKERNVVCFSGANADREIAMRNCYDYFENRYVMHIFQNEETDGNNVYVINKDGGQLKVTGIHRMMYNFNEGTAPWVLFERVLDRPEIITEATRFLVNDYYTCVFFSHKNEVYKWFYTQLNLPATPFITLPEGEEIRCLNHYQRNRGDEDYQDYSVQKEVYVASYNPNRAGEYKGSLYVYNADTGELVNKYEGISHEPVAMFYKIK